MRYALIAFLAAGMAFGAADDQRALVRVAADGLDVDFNQAWSMMPQAIYTNCVLVYPWSKDRSGTYIDYSTRHNDGSQTTADYRPTWSTNFGGVYDFDGGNDWIGVDESSGDFDFGGPYTLMAWINPDLASDQGAIIEKGYYTGSGGYMLWMYNLTCRFYVRKAVRSVVTLAQDTWQHVAAVWDGSYTYLYVNGVQGDKDAYASAPEANADDLRIGAYATYYLDAMIDDPRIYNRALSSNEVYTVYNATKGAHGL